jgi:transposase
VDEASAPYRCRPYGTPGRPPTDPRAIARFLLLKNLEGWSYDETYATLEALPELAHKAGFRGKIPAASTVAMLVMRVPIPYLEELITRTARRRVRGRTNVAGDATGVATHRYQRWFDVRHGKNIRRRRFVKLHAIVATRAEWPFFLSARVTRGTRNDSPELEPLLDQLDPSIELGNGVFDRGYQSRQNAQLIEARGGLPVIDLKKNATAQAHGYPEWKRMVYRQWTDRRAFRCRYRRRTLVEGVFGAVKRRFGEIVQARRRHAQRIEILCRVVVWNALGLVYDQV